MDLQVSGLEDLKVRVELALDRIGDFQAGTPVESDAFFSGRFMADHTDFESFDAFCAQSPWALDSIGDIQDVPRDRLDEYVAERTDFETWEGMKTRAAQEDIIEQVVS